MGTAERFAATGGTVAADALDASGADAVVASTIGVAVLAGGNTDTGEPSSAAHTPRQSPSLCPMIRALNAIRHDAQPRRAQCKTAKQYK
jgi:hypothetical protein